MKDFDWFASSHKQYFINSSVKVTRSNACIKFHCDYRIYIKIVLSNFLEFLFVLCFKAENKSNKQYFERALSKSLTKLGHTTLKEQQKSCIRKLVVDSQDQSQSLLFCQLASAKVLFIRSYRRCFLSYIAFVMVR
jgi:hypothetical protein